MTENLFFISATKPLYSVPPFFRLLYCCYTCFFHFLVFVIRLNIPVLQQNLQEASKHAWVQAPAQLITLTLYNIFMIHPFLCVF